MFKVNNKDTRTTPMGPVFSFNHLSANPTKWSNTINSSAVADELFECV